MAIFGPKFEKIGVLWSGPVETPLVHWTRIHDRGPILGKKCPFWSFGPVALVQNPTLPPVGPESTLIKNNCNIFHPSSSSPLLLQS